jgi:hypothetical protein
MVAAKNMRMMRMNGKKGKDPMWRKGMRREEVRPIRRRVIRSPRQEAIGGAMLSVWMG